MSEFAGKWDTVANTPMGAQKGTLTLSVDGGSLSGTMSGPQGSIDIAEGSVDGDSATWKLSITNPMPMTLEFSAKVDGDELSGDVKLGAFGSASFTGTRTAD